MSYLSCFFMAILRFLLVGAGLLLTAILLVFGLMTAITLILRYQWRKRLGSPVPPSSPNASNAPQPSKNAASEEATVLDVEAREVPDKK
jgi:hypothetical protein